MKSLFSLLFFTFTLYTTAQDKIEAELLPTVDILQTPEVKIISCGGSVTNNNPLYVVDGVPISVDEIQNKNILSPDNIVSIEVLKDVPTIFCDDAAKNGVVLISTKKASLNSKKVHKNYPFKVYEFSNSNWTTTQDMLDAIDVAVPNLTISNAVNSNLTPTINMRGDTNTIVIVDGIRYDASILNALNPDDIESVKVSNNPAAQNYFINQ